MRDDSRLVVETTDEESTNGMPTFRWKNFVSSEYRSYERRKVAASVSLDNSDGTAVFKFYEYPAGEPPTSVSVTPALSPNAYLFKASYRERHKFGPLTISRESDSVVPFRIR